MTILHISDTHSKHHLLQNLPDADVLVHSGDFTMGGTEQDAYDFMNWLCDLPFRYKIFIAGNHDDCMFGADGIEGLPDNVHYLSNSGVTIEGARFYGVPMFMQDYIDTTIIHIYPEYPRILMCLSHISHLKACAIFLIMASVSRNVAICYYYNVYSNCIFLLTCSDMSTKPMGW